jgi:hypothetical protein
MHDETFPQSQEPADKRSARFEQQLHWEDSHGTGFRRRERGALGDPFGDTDLHVVDAEPTQSELVGSWLAAFGTMLGVATLVFKPLLLVFPAFMLIMAGAAIGGVAGKVARTGIIVLSICFLIGMTFAITFDQPVI